MYTVAFIMKRKPGMSLEDFLAYYRDRHGPRMVELIEDKGLIAYEHFPAAAQKEGRYLAEGGPAYDAVSVYSFTTSRSRSVLGDPRGHQRRHRPADRLPHSVRRRALPRFRDGCAVCCEDARGGR